MTTENRDPRPRPSGPEPLTDAQAAAVVGGVEEESDTPGDCLVTGCTCSSPMPGSCTCSGHTHVYSQ